MAHHLLPLLAAAELAHLAAGLAGGGERGPREARFLVRVEAGAARFEAIVEARLEGGRVEHRLERVVESSGVSPIHVASVVDALLRGGRGESMLRGRGRRVQRINTPLGSLVYRRSYCSDGWLEEAVIQGRGVRAEARRLGGCGEG